jgi:hypothetical protein
LAFCSAHGGGNLVDIAAERAREPAAIVEASHGKIEPYCAPHSPNRRLSDDDRLRDLFRDLVKHELEAVTLEHGVILVARHPIHAERADVESRSARQIFDEQNGAYARCFHRHLEPQR